MKPYLAVIYDSFLEAFKTRTLWVLLVGWTLLLGALAPFGWIEGTDFQFRNDNIINRQKLLDELKSASEGTGSVSQQRVWNALDENFKQQVTRAISDKRPLRPGTIAEGLSSALDDETLYDKEVWPTADKRNDLTKALTDYRPGKLSSEELARVNQRLIELSFPSSLKSSAGNSIWIGYGGIKLFDPIPVSRDKLRTFIDSFILIAFLKIALGIVGIFVAVIVTSNLVPDMFAPGSMALLLSKPVYRSGLLLAKFFGGLCFILINVTYLLVGFYFILGIRMGIWNDGLLLCIPLFLFVFMIFYSVSTLAGLIWKNAIVSIICVGLFWGACLIIGLTYEPLRQFSVEARQLTRLQMVDGEFVGTNRGGQLLFWNPEGNVWESATGGADGQRRIVGPLWLKDRELLVFGRASWHRFVGLQTDGVRLQSIDLRTKNTSGDKTVDEFVSSPRWSEKRVDLLPDLPAGTRRVKVAQGMILAATETGVFDYKIEVAKAPSQSTSLFGIIKLPSFGEKSVSNKLTSDELFLQAPIDMAVIPGADDVLLISKSRLYRFAWAKDDEGTLRLDQVNSLDLQLPDDATALLAANDKVCLVLTNKKEAVVVDLNTFAARDSQPNGLSQLDVKEIHLSDTGDFYLLTKEGNVHRCDSEAKSILHLKTPERVTTMCVSDDAIHTCTIGNVIQKIDLKNQEAKVVIKPTWTTAQWIYWTIVRPVYIVNPKPAAVDNLMQWALQSEEPFAIQAQTEDMEEPAEQLDLWTPIWSNSLFILVMLSISCIYLHRQDT